MITDLYEQSFKRRNDIKWISETVAEDSIDEMDEEGVDVESVPASAVNVANRALDDIVSKEDYDDSDIEDMVEDDDSELEIAIETACALATMRGVELNESFDGYIEAYQALHSSDNGYINEAVTAGLQKMKVIFGKKAKLAKQELKLAKKYAKSGDTESSRSHAYAAKQLYKELLQKSEQIDNDEDTMLILDSVVKCSLLSLASAAAVILGVNGTVVDIVGAIAAAILGMQNGKRLTYKAYDKNGVREIWKNSSSREEAKARIQKLINICDDLINADDAGTYVE